MIDLNTFLVVGRRWDVNLKRSVNFSDSNWTQSLVQFAHRHGQQHPATGIDYFVFPRGQWSKMPPFIVGVPVWDNWLLYDAHNRGIPVIDATAVVLAIHQNHPVVARPTGHVRADGPEAAWNLEHAGGNRARFTLDDAHWVLHYDGLRRARGSRYWKRRLFWALWFPYTELRRRRHAKAAAKR